MTRGVCSTSLRFGLVVFLLTALFIPKSLEERAVINASVIHSLTINENLLQDGDIIFRRGISLVSNLVLEHDTDSPYSHVGIITLDNGKVFVIHAVPDESETEIDYCKKDPLQLFLRTDRASAYAVIRYNDKFAAQHAADYAEKCFENSKIPRYVLILSTYIHFRAYKTIFNRFTF